MLKDGGRQPSNREERPLSASTVIARGQGNGWDEPCKSRGLRTVLWAAGGEIPPADPAAVAISASVTFSPATPDSRVVSGLITLARGGASKMPLNASPVEMSVPPIRM